MQRLFTLFALILALAAPACLIAAETLPRPEALSEETIYLTEKLSRNYDTIVIREFTASGAVYERVDAEERTKIDAMTPLLLSNISMTLEESLKAKKLFKTIVKNGPITGKAVIVEGGISEFNAGSRALRFWVGFGAGKTYLKFKGRLVDAATGKELATFEDRETGYKGVATMESFEGLFPHQARGIGENLAMFMEKLY